VVQYLIFEFADEGDVRKYLDLSKRLDAAWALRSLHHIATGLRQLHSQDIAHQDLKPSNVLVFEGAKVSKVADLGRASARGESPPHDKAIVAGDPEYAPLELCYDHVLSDWNPRRLGCDAYLLGGMAVFFFGQGNITAMVLDNLHPSHRPGAWRDTYPQVLPYVRDAFERALVTFGADVDRHGAHLRGTLVQMVRELCDPDPGLRGDPSQRKPGANQFSLERYITRFDLLARQEEARALRV
jgi:serine/threonine protein kinase